VLAVKWRCSRTTLIRLELNRGRRARLTRVEEGRGGAGSIELGEGGRDDRCRGEELGSSGRSFYRRPGRGRGERWRAPASSPRRGWWRTVATTGRLGQGGDGMARLAQGDRGTRSQPGR
jgi:hypothetical protein